MLSLLLFPPGTRRSLASSKRSPVSAGSIGLMTQNTVVDMVQRPSGVLLDTGPFLCAMQKVLVCTVASLNRIGSVIASISAVVYKR